MNRLVETFQPDGSLGIVSRVLLLQVGGDGPRVPLGVQR